MRVCGVIAEFDPFHKGHRYHLLETRASSRADYMVCVLGCAFSQRGDAMLFSSHDRARMALQNGYDLVLGMPVSFSCAQANRFARGGVEGLHRLGCITHLSFGCETADLRLLYEVVRLLRSPSPAFAEHLKNNLSQGLAFAKAQGLAIQACLPHLPGHLLKSPNFILGLAYLQELERLNSPIKPVVVRREGNYHSPAPGVRASAGAVRNMVQKDQLSLVSEACPEESTEVILDAIRQHRVHPKEALDMALLAKLLQSPPSSLRLSPEISEGLEERILASAKKSCTRAQLIAAVKTKRYPYARVNRALTHLLLGLKDYSPAPGYLRLLGFQKRARPLLKKISQSGFPLVDKPARSKQPGIVQDLLAEQLWHLGAGGQPAQAYREQVVIL